MPLRRAVLFATGFACFLLLAAGADAKSPTPAALKAVSGLWYSQDRDGGIELYPCGEEICGRFHWLQDNEPGNVSRDDKNPDRALRQRPLCGMQFMGGFIPQGDGFYADGWIYSPRHGANFSAEMRLVDHDTLKLHGYVFLPLLGEDQTWTRARPKEMPSCVTE